MNSKKAPPPKPLQGLLSTFAWLILSLTVTSAVLADDRPNLLFILVDDQSPFDLTLYNPRSIQDTPTIDRLAAEGMTFDGAYHMGSFSGAVCTPSRHMIMTGRSVWHLPNVEMGKYCPTDIEDNVMAAIFNRANYDTMRTCKQGNSYHAANQKFQVVRDATKRGGTHESGKKLAVCWPPKERSEVICEDEFETLRLEYAALGW